MRGLAEPTRLVFAAAHAEYKDERFPIDPVSFARPEFEAERATGRFEMNMDSLPILKYTGEEGTITIGQSKSVERFVARQFGFMGTNELQGAQIDMITEHCRDIKQKYNDSKVGKKGEEMEAAKAKFIAEQLPCWFGKLEKTLTGDGFAVGDKLSLADIVIFSLVKDYFDDLPGVWAATSETPKVRAATEAAKAAVQHWLDIRPVTKF